jgi:hypothetical protein
MLQASEPMAPDDKDKAAQTPFAVVSAPQCIASDDPRLKER